MVCPVCAHTGVYLSRRQGRMETGLLSWIGILPFRCCQCWSRFYRRAPRNILRRLRRSASGSTGGPVVARWLRDIEVEAGLAASDGTIRTLRGRADQLTVFGLTLRLPSGIEPGTPVRIRLGCGPAITGRVMHCPDDPLCVVRFDGPIDPLRLADFSSPGS